MLRISEKENLPRYTEIGRIENQEFEISYVNTEKQVLWIRTEDGRKISFIMTHIDPDSEAGQMAQRLPDSNYVILSGVRLRKGEGYIPRWYLMSISEVHQSEGSERNVFD